jgi:hypothetical protein
LAETLDNEFQGLGIDIHFASPADVLTPVNCFIIIGI